MLYRAYGHAPEVVLSMMVSTMLCKPLRVGFGHLM
jgi:hypothetical protein